MATLQQATEPVPTAVSRAIRDAVAGGLTRATDAVATTGAAGIAREIHTDLVPDGGTAEIIETTDAVLHHGGLTTGRVIHLTART